MQLLLQLFQMALYWNEERPQEVSPSKEEAALSPRSLAIESFAEEQNQRLEKRAQEYAKVELLHRILVQQQLQELEQRRRIRLLLARRRLEFVN